ncbi:Unknown protein, partial [Striga hermonthica]
MSYPPLVELDWEDLEYLENLERELTPWEQEYLEEMYEQKEEYERQLKIMEEVIEGEPLFTFDLPGYVEDKAVECEVDQVECEEQLFADEFTDKENKERKSYKHETDVEYTMVSSGDWSKPCAQEWHAQHIEVEAEGAEVVDVKEAILVEVDEDHGWDVRMVEERVPDVWMVEDESLRTKKVSKWRGMIRKWVSNPCDKKGQGPRRPEEAENRAETTHAWPKRRVRARMRGARARKEWQGTTRGSSMRGSKLVCQGIARDQARGGVRGLDARLHGSANEGCAKEGRAWRSGAQGEVVGWMAREGSCCGWTGAQQTMSDARALGALDDERGAHDDTREAQIKTGVASLILIGIGKARILIPAGIGKAVECWNARGRSVTGVILGKSGNVTGSIFLVGIGIVDMGSRH